MRYSRDQPRGRERLRADARAQQDRMRIAQAAARLIAEHGLSDWALAKRKAARQLMLAPSVAFPTDAELEEALTAHHALFGGDAHPTMLRERRREALAWMRRLAAWQPQLVGGVAAGWATEYSDIRIEVVADDAKAVEIALASQGVRYAALPARGGDDAGATLRIDTPRGALRVAVLTPQQRRNRPRRDEETRLTESALAALLEEL
jgi:hypothetical protein